ncbi:MAG: hypothetical protein IJ320_06475 [Phascolarctobacterium sp.]|nr:hypothetical protein [Phascolarctobacterium sp.]
MKDKFISFCVAMGIPVSSLGSAGGGCTGICGSCQFSCTPGVLALLLLTGKLLYKKLICKGRFNYE